MPRAMFFIKNSGRLMSIHLLPLLPSVLAPDYFYSHPVLLSILPLLFSILPLLLSIPTSASICPRPDPDLLLDTPD